MKGGEELGSVRSWRFEFPELRTLAVFLAQSPDLETLEIVKLVNCPETFTPDMRCIMGESPLVKGYYVLAGMNSAGLSFGGGAGR